MEHIAEVDDMITVTWPNGAGYDRFVVVQEEPSDGPAHSIRYEGSYMFTDKGKSVKL